MTTVVADYGELLVSKAFLSSESRRLKDAVIYEICACFRIWRE